MTIDEFGQAPFRPAFVFSSEHFEEHRLNDDDLIQLEPYGISLTQDPTRPMFLLKAVTNEQILPVPINPLEAGVTLSQSTKTTLPTTPHKVTELLLETLNIKISRCVFVEIKGHHQYVRLYLDNHPTHGSLKARADEAMSLCLHLGTEFYATANFMRRSRVMNAEIDGLQKDLSQNANVLQRTHEYLI